jgi:hypothetical protein
MSQLGQKSFQRSSNPAGQRSKGTRQLQQQLLAAAGEEEEEEQLGC